MKLKRRYTTMSPQGETKKRHRSRDPEATTQAKEATKLGFGEEPRRIFLVQVEPEMYVNGT